MSQNRSVSVSRVLSASALAAVVVASPTPAEDRPRPLATGHAEEVLVRRARYPVRIEENRPGACEGLTPARVEMLIGGEPAAVDAVERVRLETVHAVLIDTSNSMNERGRIERATEAARGYVRSLPADEPVLLATFDEDLVLRLPPTPDREAFERTLDEIGTGTYTALNDALYDTIRYLAPRPERKVIVVMTDGCDSASLNAHLFRTVLELAEETENLTVFPIGIELPAQCGRGVARIGPVVGPDSLLHQLGVVSGGELFRVRQMGDFSTVFERIRQRLDQEGHVIYRPIAPDPASRDLRAGGRRRIRIRALGLKGCHVERAGSSLVIDDVEEQGVIALAGDEPVETAALPTGVPLSVRLPEWWRVAPGSDSGSLTVEPGRVRGRLPDIATDRGPLYSERVYRRSGRYRILKDLSASYDVRDFDLAVPDFDFVKERLDGPAALASYLLERGERPFKEGPDGSLRLGPGWLQGQMLLELRGLLGRAIYSQPGYRAWAEARLWSLAREDLRLLLEQSGLEEPERRRFLEATERRGYEPGPRDPQRVLADWLGDLTLDRLAAAVDREGAADALGGRSSIPAARVREAWSTLLSWFPPPTRVRVIAPLVPVHDAQRNVFGFYRIVLPVSLEGQPPATVPPAVPIGTLLAESLQLGGVQVDAVSYPEIGKALARRLRRLGRGRGLREPRAVRLTLRGTDGEPRSVTGYFLLPRDAWSREIGEGGSPQLACVEPDPARPLQLPAALRPCGEISGASR